MELAQCLAKLSTSFHTPFFELPGFEVQKIMSPKGRNTFIKTYNGIYKKSAVLILLFPNSETNHTEIVFIERTKDESPHSGQIALPGGTYEDSDKNLIQTAIRETQEEIGVTIDSTTILGQLTPLKVPVSSYEITPVVGYINSSPTFSREEKEVASIITYPIEKLINTPIENTQFKTRNGFGISAPYYPIEEHKLWGATAMIIAEFLALLK